MIDRIRKASYKESYEALEAINAFDEGVAVFMQTKGGP